MKIRIHNPIYDVPIIFLDKYNPEQFEITYLVASHSKAPKGIENKVGSINGKWVYARIFIKKKVEV